MVSRKVGYTTSSEGQTELFNWLRENPHRLHLGQIGLNHAKEIEPADITQINQELDLWRGILTSKFKLFGDRYRSLPQSILYRICWQS